MNHDVSEPSQAIWSPSQPSARRSLILCALGALLGLGIAGLGLFTAKGTRTATVPAEDVAVVNQVPILMSDYIVQLRALYDVSLSDATAAQKKQALDDMIREELYVQRGVELGMQSDTIEVRTALVGAVESQAAADATMSQPGEGDLAAFYRANILTYATAGTMDAADYVMPAGSTLAAATAAGAEIRALGASPAVLARHGLRSSGRLKQGDEFYFAARIHLGPRLFDEAKKLARGAVSAPVAMADGLHILVMKTNEAPVPQPYSATRDHVLRDYIDRQSKLLTEGNDRFLRKRADILVAKGFE